MLGEVGGIEDADIPKESLVVAQRMMHRVTWGGGFIYPGGVRGERGHVPLLPGGPAFRVRSRLPVAEGRRGAGGFHDQRSRAGGVVAGVGIPDISAGVQYSRVQPLPGVLDPGAFERVKAEPGWRDICDRGKVAYRSREAQAKICEGCYARLVRERNGREGVRLGDKGPEGIALRTRGMRLFCRRYRGTLPEVMRIFMRKGVYNLFCSRPFLYRRAKNQRRGDDFWISAPRPAVWWR